MCNRGHSQRALPFSVLGECKRYARKKNRFSYLRMFIWSAMRNHEELVSKKCSRSPQKVTAMKGGRGCGTNAVSFFNKMLRKEKESSMVLDRTFFSDFNPVCKT